MCTDMLTHFSPLTFSSSKKILFYYYFYSLLYVWCGGGGGGGSFLLSSLLFTTTKVLRDRSADRLDLTPFLFPLLYVYSYLQHYYRRQLFNNK